MKVIKVQMQVKGTRCERPQLGSRSRVQLSLIPDRISCSPPVTLAFDVAGHSVPADGRTDSLPWGLLILQSSMPLPWPSQMLDVTLPGCTWPCVDKEAVRKSQHATEESLARRQMTVSKSGHYSLFL